MKKYYWLFLFIFAAGSLTAGLLFRQQFNTAPQEIEEQVTSTSITPILIPFTAEAAVHPTSTPSESPTATNQAKPAPAEDPAPGLPVTNIEIIGLSVAGRPLEMYRFGNGPLQQLIVAGIHGGYEWNTVVLADELIDFLKNNPGVIPEERSLYILRVFNPDGYARSTGFSGRANHRNVDLNRNFPHSWQAEWPLIGCWSYLPINGGMEPASEPETRALINFINDHQIHSMISYHSAALGIFAGGQPPDAKSLSLAQSIADISPYPYPPIDAGCLYTGQLIDWASDRGIAAVDIELSNHQDTDFEINLAILSTFLSWENPEQ